MKWLRQYSKIDLLVTAFTILGVNAFDFLTVLFPSFAFSPLHKVALSLVFIGVYGYLASTKDFKVRHTFPEASKDEANFFKEWYSRPGTLHIFSKELTWLDTIEYAETRHALHGKAQARELHLYVRDHLDDEVVRELVGRGARLYPIRSDIHSTHRFSVRVDSNIASIIIRNKETEPKRITFEEYANHEALVNLALDMTNNCYERPQPPTTS